MKNFFRQEQQRSLEPRFSRIETQADSLEQENSQQTTQFVPGGVNFSAVDSGNTNAILESFAHENREFRIIEKPFESISLNNFLNKLLSVSSLAKNSESVLKFFEKIESTAIKPDIIAKYLFLDFEINKKSQYSLIQLLTKTAEILGLDIELEDMKKIGLKANFNPEKLKELIFSLLVSNKDLRKDIKTLSSLAKAGIIEEVSVLNLFSQEEVFGVIKESGSPAYSLPLGNNVFAYPALHTLPKTTGNIKINTGPCLFGIPDFQAVCKDENGKETWVSLVDPTERIEGEVVELLANPNGHFSEMESYERFAQMIKIIIKKQQENGNLPKITINIPNGEYNFYGLFEALSEGKCSKELYLKYTEIVEARSQKNIQDYKQVLREVLSPEFDEENLLVNQPYDFLVEFVREKVENNEIPTIDQVLYEMQNTSKLTSEDQSLLIAIIETTRIRKGESLNLDFRDVSTIAYVFALLRNALDGSFSLGVEGINERRIFSTAASVIKDPSFPKDLKEKIENSGLAGFYVVSSIRPTQGDPGSHKEYDFLPTQTHSLSLGEIDDLEGNQELSEEILERNQMQNQALQRLRNPTKEYLFDEESKEFLDRNNIPYSVKNGEVLYEAPYSNTSGVIDELRQKLQELYRS